MPFKFASISFNDIIKRLLKSPCDVLCFQSLADQFYPTHDAKLKTNDYKRANKQQKADLLQEIGEKCASLPKYKDYRREDVILTSIHKLVPAKWFKSIFGHVDKEEQLYADVKRFLKKKFSDHKVIDTYDMRSRVGIRWADFTVIKKRALGGFQLMSFDVKTKLGAFDYFLNQAHDFSRFSDYTSLFCTAGLILELSKKERKSPSKAEGIFMSNLEKRRISLYVVDAESGNIERLVESDVSDDLDKELKNRALRELGLAK